MRYLLALILLFSLCAIAKGAEIPSPGKVTLLDLGSDCLPCEVQDRIVRRMEKEFGDTVSVMYLDVEKNTQYRFEYKIDVIPTLIFYDKKGREVERKIGYMKEGAMRKLLKKLTGE